MQRPTILYVRSLAMLLMFTCAAHGAAGGPAGEEQTRVLAETKYARVIGEPSAASLAHRAAAVIDRAVPRIAPIIGTTDLRPVVAVVYPDRKAFREAVDSPPQSTVVGLATFPSGIIHIDGTGLLSSIERIVPHEVGHVMIARAVGPALPDLPIWVNEGIAEYVAGERAAQVDPVSLRAIGRGSALKLADLDSTFRARSRQSSLAYAQSASLVNFLVDEHGEQVIVVLLVALRRTRDFDAALGEATGLRLEELEAEWRGSIGKRWRWHLLFQSPVLPFTLMLLLFLVGLARYILQRRRRQEMPEQY